MLDMDKSIATIQLPQIETPQKQSLMVQRQMNGITLVNVKLEQVVLTVNTFGHVLTLVDFGPTMNLLEQLVHTTLIIHTM